MSETSSILAINHLTYRKKKRSYINYAKSQTGRIFCIEKFTVTQAETGKQNRNSSFPPLEEEDEVGDFGILEEGLILFRMSGPNESPIRNDQSDEDLASSGDSAVYSLRR